ncbi:MAG: hypothetical protein RL139_199 [Gemmatimonadota bacterium]|jgi:hypothetical protein
MRRVRSLALLLILAPTLLTAQSGSVLQDAVNRYNAPAATRVQGAYDLPVGRTVEGDVTVLNGPATIAGRVTGAIVVINGDARLDATADVGGDVVLVGGTLDRAEGSRIGGDIRVQAEVLRYTLEADGRLIPEEPRFGEWRTRRERREAPRSSSTELFHTSARPYNRVEGLPILIGPKLRRRTAWGAVEVEALGIVRTAGPVAWDRGTLGHDASTTIHLGATRGLTLGARAFDIVAPVESWQISDTEAGLSTWIAHRDLRDYSGRHGWEGRLGGRLGLDASLDLYVGREQWQSVAARDPVTLTRAREPWRVNPSMDVGTVRTRGARVLVDTREKTRAPWLGGWYVQADLEHAQGTITRDIGPLRVLADAQSADLFAPILPEPVRYTRGFIDARRRTRLSPGTELSVRVVAGGWLAGDRLPLQRRLSLGGPGTVEGYDFRRSPRDSVDVFTCGGIGSWDGQPTLCDRVALAQVEIRQPLGFHWDVGGNDWRIGFDETPSWVLFADAGRGWTTAGSDDAAFTRHGLPPFSSFRTSLGAGIDFGGIGIYVAKAVSTGQEPMNVLVRLGRRF